MKIKIELTVYVDREAWARTLLSEDHAETAEGIRADVKDYVSKLVQTRLVEEEVWATHEQRLAEWKAGQ